MPLPMSFKYLGGEWMGYRLTTLLTLCTLMKLKSWGARLSTNVQSNPTGAFNDAAIQKALEKVCVCVCVGEFSSP